MRLVHIINNRFVFQTADGNIKDDLKNKALPLSVYSVDNENIKPPLIQGRSREEVARPRRR